MLPTAAEVAIMWSRPGGSRSGVSMGKEWEVAGMASGTGSAWLALSERQVLLGQPPGVSGRYCEGVPQGGNALPYCVRLQVPCVYHRQQEIC